MHACFPSLQNQDALKKKCFVDFAASPCNFFLMLCLTNITANSKLCTETQQLLFERVNVQILFGGEEGLPPLRAFSQTAFIGQHIFEAWLPSPPSPLPPNRDRNRLL